MQICRKYLAMACGRIAGLCRHYAPIIWQSIKIHARNIRQWTLKFCRLGLDQALRFTHRLIFMTTVLCIRIAELLRYYTPIVRQHTVRICRICLEHALRFIYRIIFMATVLCIRIAELLRHYTPIVRQRTVKIYRLGLELATRFIYRIIFKITVLCIRIAELLRYYTPIVHRHTVKIYRLCLELATRFIYRIIFKTTVLCIRIAELLRYYTPIVRHYIRTRLQSAGRVTWTFCRFLYRQAVTITRATALAVWNTCLLITGFLYRLTRRIVLTVIAICRWIISRVRHYPPLILRAIGRGLRTTAYALITCCRALLQVTGNIILAGARAVLSISALIIKVLRKLLLAAGTCLLLAAKIVRRWLHGIRVVAARAGERLYQYALLVRLNKPIGIFLLLWPTLWALWIAADGAPDLPLLLIFLGGVVLMRSAGCIINDLADRDFDAQVSRTRERPLATGKVTPREALAVAAVLILGAFLLVLQLNLLTIELSVMGVLLAIIYPLTKRYTYMPQLFLGLAFGWAVPMAFAAQTGAVPPMGWILFMATVLWALVYDTLYAMVDREEDIQLGIKSTAILFEDADRFIIGAIQILVVATLLLIGYRLEFNQYYYAGLALAALLFIYQQHLIRDRIPQQCFMAFMDNNWFGAIVFGGILMNYQYG